MEVSELWHRVLNEPRFQDLPYKIETNQHGQIVLSPHKSRRSRRQARLVSLLDEFMTRPGECAVEFAVFTAGGVKIPDVAWLSIECLDQLPEDAEASPVMPEIVVEVLSAGNARVEMEEKRRLYFETGAVEVWTCDADGAMTFQGPEGALSASSLAPHFPDVVR